MERIYAVPALQFAHWRKAAETPLPRLAASRTRKNTGSLDTGTPFAGAFCWAWNGNTKMRMMHGAFQMEYQRRLQSNTLPAVISGAYYDTSADLLHNQFIIAEYTRAEVAQFVAN